jgi:hypothetical protein
VRRFCEPAGVKAAPILDFLRTNFALFVAVALPLAGVVLAIAKYTAGDREDAYRVAAASLLGCFLYALLLT